MRLIDADKLLPNLWVCYEENKPIVDAEPTVNAIPIEWLEKCKDRYILCCTIIDDIIEEWREQNGRGQMD